MEAEQIKMYLCDWAGCNKAFKRKEHLRRHVDSVHQKVKLPCKFCKKLFAGEPALKRHEEESCILNGVY